MSRTTKLLMPVTVLLSGVLWAEPALAAVSVSRAEVSGSQLRIEGTAIASRDIKVDGVVMGRSDSGGKFRIERSGYVSPADCTVDLTDGSATVTSARLSGCTVSSPPPPPPPSESAALEGLTVNPTSVTGGSPSTGRVTLTAAPASDLAVSLSSDAAAATVPATVTVPAGSTSAQFSISTTRVAASSAVTITAARDGVTRSAFLTVAAPAALAGLTVSPTSVTGGSPSTGTITLTSSQDRDLAVSLSSSDSAAATVPATVTVPAGAAGVQFTISTSQVTTTRGATITAVYDGVTRTATLTVNPPPVAAPTALDRLTVSPTTVTGGTPSTGTVTLTAAAPTGGVNVSLSSDWTAVATVPATVTVPTGATSAQFTVTTFQVSALSAVTITAAYDGVTRSASLTVNPAGAEGLFFLTPAQLPDATVGQSYLASIVCSDPDGPSTFDFKLVSGRVPAGTRFLENTLENRPEARVSGTPSARGTFSFTVEVEDNTGATARRTFTVRVL